MKSRIKPFFLACAATLLLVSACADSGIQSDPSYTDKEQQQLYKNGSLASDNGGIDLFGGDSSAKAGQGAGIGVNGFLWRATLDTIAFMPIKSADPFGGVIITDWYADPKTPDQRARLNVFIRSRDLRADGVTVSVFRQKKNDAGQWADAAVDPTTAADIENEILTRARQIRLAQKDLK
ncbi:MAG TPA: DUF3576 domain-containing protein [Alphaproteobacteria bacterium]|nr:DUF3576 domain-containing protein [Alphaproteobacteria bacterium]